MDREEKKKQTAKKSTGGRSVTARLKKTWDKLEDGWEEYLFQRKKQKKKLEKQMAAMSPQERKEFQAKRRKTSAAKPAAIIGLCLVGILLIVGVTKLIGMAGRAIFREKQPETELAVQTESETEKIYQEADITVGSTGCMLLHSPFIDSYPDAEGNYDFSSIYKYITPYYSKPDFMTCEFEGALGGPELGYAGFPNFKSPDIIIENIRDSGVDLQMLATNHIYDGLSYAFNRTMEVYEEKGIAYTGIRKDKDSKNYYIADINGVCVGFINYVYETTNMTGGPDKSLNAIVMESQDAPLLNSFNYDNLEPFYAELENSIYNMRQDGAHFIIANMHWGMEYQLQEAVYQDEIAQNLCNMGVDAIMGGHPHCEQPIDMLTSQDGSHKMFCIYSMGNALSNQRVSLMMEEMPTGHTEDGVMVTLHLHQDTDGTVSLTDVELLPTWVYRYTEPRGSKYFILPLDDVANIETTTGISGIYDEAQASYDRTMEELGPGLEKARESIRKTMVCRID